MNSYDPHHIANSGNKSRLSLGIQNITDDGTVFALASTGFCQKGKGAMSTFDSNSRCGESGRTLLEITVVVMVAGVITATSVMMFGNGKARYDLRSKAQNLSWQIERARSLAVKYNQTLTLGFSSYNSVFGITSTGCPEAVSELPSMQIPSTVALSAYPSITIKGNGTIQATNQTIVVSDGQGRQVQITIANSGRTAVGDVSDYSTTTVH
jgi:Type II transport protein GspH